MSVVKKGASALGKLFVLIALAATFLVGMAGVVYMSLQGNEIKVPEIVGKDLNAGEQELASLGLQIKKRASRPSTEKMNTILEQLPKAGDTVKTGQKILVVVSEAGLSGEDIPATIKKTDEDDTEKIEELISDKPKKNNKANTNANKKKTSTTRDVLSNNSNSASSNSANSNSSGGNSTTSGNKNAASNSSKSATPTDAKPTPAKTPAKPTTSGDTRPRKTP